ncbi:MAG: TetR/AcrR family transcriptional regulator, partial [Myxococcaceae bacterium]
LEKGLNETSIDDITQAADVAKGSFYRYFADKEALIEALLKPVSDDVLAGLDACGRALETVTTAEAMFAAYRVLGEGLAATILGHMDVVRLYLQESRGAPVGARARVVELSDAIAKSAIDVTKKAHKHGILRPIHPSVSALAVVGAMERIMVGLLNGEDVGNPLEIPDGLITLILYGLRAPEKQ